MRRILVVVALVAGGAVAVWRVGGRAEFTLPVRLTVEEPVAELTTAFDRHAVVAQEADAPVEMGEIHPGEQIRGAGRRAGLIAPPRSRVRFKVMAAADLVLRFGVGVAGDRRRAPDRSGIRFSVALDNVERWARVVNPAATRADRRWYDAEIDLSARAGQPVEIMLGTDAERGDVPLAGTPAWSRLRLVRRITRDRQPADRAHPNVLVLLVDTLRADRLGCYGARPSPSPTLDRLAGAGLLFEHVTSQSSWTLPSVASIMSGLHPRRHGALQAGKGHSDVPEGREFLTDAVVTWAERAAGAGITTVGVSANPLVSRATNVAQGFETFVDMPWDPAGRRWSTAAEVNDVFLRWLARNRTQRFVAYLHYLEPHDPYTPPPALRPPPPPGVRPAIAAGWIRGATRETNWGTAGHVPAAELEYVRRLYDAEIRSWDLELEALLGGLERLGVRDSTLVVVTADHGEEFQEHGHLTHGSHLYQESLHVPLVLVGPGIASERRADEAQGLDLHPTLTAYLGLDASSDLPGRDLLATRVGAPVISETGRGIGPDGVAVRLIAVRRDGWKLIHTPTLARFELYDLVHDPAERDDRFGRAPEAAALTAVLAGWHPEMVPAPGGVPTEPGMVPTPAGAPAEAGCQECVRALGYVE